MLEKHVKTMKMLYNIRIENAINEHTNSIWPSWATYLQNSRGWALLSLSVWWLLHECLTSYWPSFHGLDHSNSSEKKYRYINI